MNKANVIIFLKSLGGLVKNSNKKWVTCSCVYAKWKHSGGVDNNPSSGMTVNDKGESSYNCFTCGSHGTPDQIYSEIKYLNSRDKRIKLDKKLILKLLTEDSDPELNLIFPDYEEGINKKRNKLKKFNEYWYRSYSKAYEHPYIKNRGVSKDLAKKLDIRYDGYYKRILFPVRDWDSKLMGVHGRAIQEDVQPRYYAYPRDGITSQERNPDVWMGENHVDLDQPVILTEGQFDYAKVYPFYKNVLCGLTTQMSEGKLKRISAASEIITMFDWGVGGDLGRESISKVFKDISVQHLFVPERFGDLGNTPDEFVYELVKYIY